MTKFADVRKVMLKVSPEKTAQLELTGRIKGIRERQAISQSELSRITEFPGKDSPDERKAKVPQKTISRIESRLSVPNLETFSKLADALGYSLEVKLNEKTTD